MKQFITLFFLTISIIAIIYGKKVNQKNVWKDVFDYRFAAVYSQQSINIYNRKHHTRYTVVRIKGSAQGRRIGTTKFLRVFFYASPMCNQIFDFDNKKRCRYDEFRVIIEEKPENTDPVKIAVKRLRIGIRLQKYSYREKDFAY